MPTCELQAPEQAATSEARLSASNHVQVTDTNSLIVIHCDECGTYHDPEGRCHNPQRNPGKMEWSLYEGRD